MSARFGIGHVVTVILPVDLAIGIVCSREQIHDICGKIC